MKHAAICAAFSTVAMPLTGVLAQALSPAPMFEGDTTMPAKNGSTQPVHVSIQSWAIAKEQELPLRGFYVAHLVSGQLSATIDGKSKQHLPGDYWTVKAGESMQVKVIGEVALLETTVVSKR